MSRLSSEELTGFRDIAYICSNQSAAEVLSLIAQGYGTMVVEAQLRRADCRRVDQNKIGPATSGSTGEKAGRVR